MGEKPRKDLPTEQADGTQLTAGTPSKSLVQNMPQTQELPLHFNGPNVLPHRPAYQEHHHSTTVWCYAQEGIEHVYIQLETWL